MHLRLILDLELAGLADRGQPVVEARPESAASRVLLKVADEVVNQVSARGLTLPILNN